MGSNECGVGVEGWQMTGLSVGNARCGRATSFVVLFVMALYKVNAVAVNTILVLHVGVIGHHVPRH